jgi:O-antigen/teichoic acid export membrane protein
VVTTVFTLVLVRWFAPLIRLVFSTRLLRESLRFGLPRLPHGVAQQVIGSSDKYVLGRFVSLHEVGLYSTGSSFGQGLKLFLSSFEQAWAPFYFGVMREPDAKATFARVTTYGVLILALLVTGLAACARDLITVIMPPAFHQAADVVPWVGLGVALQGVYLLTSIGLNITKHTEYYPMATAIAAGTSVAANLILVPNFGIIGAAWANAIAYAVLASVSYRFSQRFFPVTYETGRLLRVIGASLVALLASRLLVPALRPLAGLIAHGIVVLVVFGAALVLSRFFIPHEIEQMTRLVARVRRRKVIEQPADATELAGEIVSTPTTDLAVEVEQENGQEAERA